MGHLYYLNNNLRSWSSKKQLIVALSFCESEYMALTKAGKEVIWLNRLLN